MGAIIAGYGGYACHMTCAELPWLTDFLFFEDGLSASFDLDLRFLLFFFFFLLESESDDSDDEDVFDESDEDDVDDEMVITSSSLCPRVLLISFLNRLSCKFHYNNYRFNWYN